MKKKKYIVPAIENHILPMESLMIAASPGVSNEEFDPAHDEIGAKENPWAFRTPTLLPLGRLRWQKSMAMHTIGLFFTWIVAILYAS